MITNTNQWSHPRDNPVVPSPWQATVDAPGVAASKITDKFLVSRWGGKGILRNQVQRSLGLGFQA